VGVLLSLDSMPGSASVASLDVVGVGVAGWNAMVLVRNGAGSARCWVLRRHLCGFVPVVCSWWPLLVWSSNAARWCGGVVVVAAVGWGVVVC
jgi:hypothetical protein